MTKGILSSEVAMRYIILGAGGAGRTVASVCHHLGGELGFLDDGVTAREVNGIPVLGKVADRIHFRDDFFIVGYGNRFMVERHSIFHQMQTEELRFFNAIAPQAFVDPNAKLGIGVVLTPHCAILPNATIGNNCHLCVACTVDHDSILGEGVYLSPGVNLAGAVVIDEGAFVGTNATVGPGVHIGAWAKVGAGAVVLRDVAPGDTVAGVPARSLDKKGEIDR